MGREATAMLGPFTPLKVLLNNDNELFGCLSIG
jgi:hypothetical protein